MELPERQRYVPYLYPWYGTSYNLALEPHSSLFPMLQRAIEQRHTIRLDPAAELSTQLEASISQASK